MQGDHLYSEAIVVLQEPKILKREAGVGRFWFDPAWAWWWLLQAPPSEKVRTARQSMKHSRTVWNSPQESPSLLLPFLPECISSVSEGLVPGTAFPAWPGSLRNWANEWITRICQGLPGCGTWALLILKCCHPWLKTIQFPLNSSHLFLAFAYFPSALLGGEGALNPVFKKTIA